MGQGGCRQSCTFGDWCSSPRKEKYSKNPTEICSSPRKEKHSKPQRGKAKRNPRKEEYPGISNPNKYPSWCQKEIIPRCQRKHSNKDLSWCQKELIPRCQQEHFVPTKFEIQIWVFNFWRGVEYSKI